MLHTTYSCDAGPLHTIRLSRDEGQTESDDEILRERIAALFAFSQGWLTPLSISLSVECCDLKTGSAYGTSRPRRPKWHIKATRVPVNIDQSPLWTDCEDVAVDTIDEMTLHTVTSRVTAECACQAGASACITDIICGSLRVRLPLSGVTSIAIEDRGGRVSMTEVVRDSDADWISGPVLGATAEPPFLVGVYDGELRIDIHWDLWMTEAGRRDWEGGVARVLARGTGWYLPPSADDASR